ncbi:MAG: hemerythrin domain-containing protein [Sulfuriferula sp.]
MNEEICDLTHTAASHLQTAAFYEIKDMPRGATANMLFANDPAIVLHSLNLQLRNNLRWEVSRTPAGHWLAIIHRAEDVPPIDVLDALKRDHKRLDAMFSRVIHLTDQNHLIEAQKVMQSFTAGLEQHLAVEHDLLAKAIRTAPNELGQDPTSAMIIEHNEILKQSAMIAAGFEEPGAGASSVSPLLAILAGYLSKHEQREELSLFPIWTSAISHAPESARAELFARVMAILEIA